MIKFDVVIPVTAWMKVGEVEAKTGGDAMDMIDEGKVEISEYPKLCECCAKKFDLSEPDETGISVTTS